MKLNELPDRETVEYSEFAGQALAFDGYISLYQFLTAITRDGDYVRNRSGENISHLLGIMNRFGGLLEENVRPIIVLDGGYPDLKDETAAERAEANEEARQNYLEAKEQGDVEGMKQWHRQRVSITDHVLESSQEVLDAMGIPVVQAPSEGEPQAAQLVADGDASYPVTEDYDVVMYHPSMVRQCSQGTAEIMDFASPMMDLGWEHEHLIWHSILLGTDYNTSPYGVGAVGAKNIVEEADDFAEVVSLAQDRDQKDVIDPDRWWETYEWCKEPDVQTNVNPTHGDFDPDRFRELLVEKYELLEPQVESRIDGILTADSVEAE